MHPKQSEMIKDFQYQFDKNEMLGLSYTHLDVYQQAFRTLALLMILIWID